MLSALSKQVLFHLSDLMSRRSPTAVSWWILLVVCCAKHAKMKESVNEVNSVSVVQSVDCEGVGTIDQADRKMGGKKGNPDQRVCCSQEKTTTQQTNVSLFFKILLSVIKCINWIHSFMASSKNKQGGYDWHRKPQHCFTTSTIRPVSIANTVISTHSSSSFRAS